MRRPTCVPSIYTIPKLKDITSEDGRFLLLFDYLVWKFKKSSTPRTYKRSTFNGCMILLISVLEILV